MGPFFCQLGLKTVLVWEVLVARLRAGLLRVLRENWLLLLIIGGILVAFLVLRTPGSAVASVEEVDALLRGGQPTLVEFYSNT
jgi:hypothetical protein